MFWRKRISYGILLPPVTKNLDRLTKEEAQAYFDWFTGKLDERVEYLRTFSKCNLDYTPKSLVPLWAWFLRNAEIEITPGEQLKKLRKDLEKAGFPLVEEVLRDKTRQFTLETECIIRDIGMYLGEIFVKSHPCLYWSYYTKPKNDLFVNRPLLMGFPNEVFPEKKGMPFEPIHMTHVRASRLLDGMAGKKDLLELYDIWESMFR